MARSEWIFVETATKWPRTRTGSSPFEWYETGFDPNNPDTPFGPTQEHMFLPVTRVPEPGVNDVTEQTLLVETEGVDGVYPGHYVDPDWIVEYNVIPQDLDISKEIKHGQLIEDYDAHMEEGWVIGPYTFPFTFEFLSGLVNHKQCLENSIEEGDVPADRTITFSDMNGKEVAVNLAQLKNHLSGYYVDYQTPHEIVVRKRDNIALASTVEEVDAVSWNFGVSALRNARKRQ